MKRNTLVHVPPQSCPNCQATLSGLAEARARVALPRPGDWTICGYCSEVLVFAHDLVVRKADLGDYLRLSDVEREDLRRVRAKVAEIQERRRRD